MVLCKKENMKKIINFSLIFEALYLLVFNKKNYPDSTDSSLLQFLYVSNILHEEKSSINISGPSECCQKRE